MKVTIFTNSGNPGASRNSKKRPSGRLFLSEPLFEKAWRSTLFLPSQGQGAASYWSSEKPSPGPGESSCLTSPPAAVLPGRVRSKLSPHPQRTVQQSPSLVFIMPSLLFYTCRSCKVKWGRGNNSSFFGIFISRVHTGSGIKYPS